MKSTIIIPVYNEESVLANCLDSLSHQTDRDFETIVVDDGSTDGSKKFATYQQVHKGPGAARNLGSKHAKGKILVFVDADMEFDKDFLKKLIAPIEEGKVIGTFSKEEFLLNKDKPLARCWNLNLGRDPLKMEPKDYVSSGWKANLKSTYKKMESGSGEEVREDDKQHVFRAILKSEFDKAGGFDENIGYTDDWTISRKLGKLALSADGAIYYHKNPETMSEVWHQSRWFGKNEFLTKNLTRKLFNLIRYNPLFGLVLGVFGAIKFKEPMFLPFKLVYDTGVFTSVALSFFNEQKAK